MATQNYGTVAPRNILRAELEMLVHAEPIMVLGTFGVQKSQPTRKSDTVVFRRLKPFNSNTNETPNITAANFQTSEGVTPDAHTIDYTDVSVTLKQYAILFKYTSKAELMYEEDIPSDMSKLTGETLAEVAELVAYGVIKAGTSVNYANGSTRVGLTSKISVKKLRQCARTMETNRAKKVTDCIKPGPNFGTSSVEASYIVFVHTDVVADIRDLPGVTKRTDYGTAIKPVHEREFAECEGFRFVTSPMFAPYLAAGAAVASTGMLAANDTNLDVYPCIIMAADAWGHVSLKGKENKTSISPTIIPAGQKNHANPIGMFGYVGADFWYAPVRLNENHMTRLEVCVTDLD